MRKAFLYAIALLVPLIWLFFAVAQGSDGPDDSLMFLLGILASLALVVYLVVRWLRHWLKERDFFSPLVAFPLAYITWFTLGSIGTAAVEEYDVRVCLYAALGLVCYILGARLFLKGKREEITPVRNNWNRESFWFVILVMGALTILSYSYLISQMGIPALSSVVAESRLEIVKYGPTQAVLVTSAFTVMILLGGHLWNVQEKPALRRLCWLCIVLIAVFMISLGSRGFLFSPLLTMLIARHYFAKQYGLRRLVIVGLVVFAGLSIYGYLRDKQLTEGSVIINPQEDIGTVIFPFIYAFDYIGQPVATLQALIQLIPEGVPYQHGVLTFGALATLLPGRHEMADMFFKRILGNDFIGGGQPGTLLAPFYGDFGLLGILLGMFLLGALTGKVYSWMCSGQTVFRILIYAWVMHITLLSLFGAIFPYIHIIWIPLFWWFLNSVVLKRSPFRIDHRNVAVPFSNST